MRLSSAQARIALEVSSVPLSLTIVLGLPRPVTSRSSSQATRVPDSLDKPQGATSATSSPSAPSVEESQNYQKHDGADRCGDDGGYDAATKGYNQTGQQPTADKGADDPKGDVGDETEAGA